MRKNNLLLLVAAVLVPYLAWAGVDGPPPGFIVDHPKAVSWLFAVTISAFTVSMAIIAFFLSRMVKQSDQTNLSQWKEIQALHKADADLREIIIQIKAEHDVYHGGIGRRASDKFIMAKE